MRNGWKLGAAVVGGVIATGAAALALAGGGGNSISGVVAEQTTVWTGRHVAPKEWTKVPDIGDLHNANNEHALIFGADMVRGNARFRIRQGATILGPGAILFAAKGANSFAWAYPDGCVPLDDEPELEWKRVGKRRAIAARMSKVDLHNELGCA